MDRREFFRLGFKKSKETAVKAVELGVKSKFKRWVLRPPGAISEEQFLMTCTRCGDCVKACPYTAIHLIELLDGGVLAGTPFIDPEHSPCRFCTDMPCIRSCQPKALKFKNEQENQVASRASVGSMGVVQFDTQHCLISQGQHCDYCFKSCPPEINAISKQKDGTPQFDLDRCVGCGKCAYICVSQSGKAISIEPK